MLQLPTTNDQDRARELIEDAVRTLAYCGTCGNAMLLVVRDEELWAECTSLSGKHGLRLELASGFHDRHRVELPEGVLSAA